MNHSVNTFAAGSYTPFSSIFDLGNECASIILSAPLGNGCVETSIVRREVADTHATHKDAPMSELLHTSECAVHNAPALPVGPCNCGVQAKAERRYAAWLGRLACNEVARLGRRIRSWLLK